VVAGAEPVLDRHERHPGHDVCAAAVAVGPEQQVAGPQTEPGPVAQGVAHRDPFADHRIRQGEAGQVGAHRLIPFHPALVDHHGQAGGGDILGVGGDGEQGPVVDAPRLAHLSHAIAARQDRLAVPDQGHRQGRLVGKGFQTAPHIGVDGHGQIGMVIGRVPGPGRQRGEGDSPGGGTGGQGGAAGQADRHGQTP